MCILTHVVLLFFVCNFDFLNLRFKYRLTVPGTLNEILLLLQIPESYKDLIAFFRQTLSLATADRPLVLVLDSLDQLSNEDFAKNLKWLSLRDPLPANVHLIVSTLPGQCLDVLAAFLPSQNVLHVAPLEQHEGPAVLDQMLSSAGRSITSGQRDVIMSAFSRCPLPLYLRLAVDIAVRWRSYDQVGLDEFPVNVSSLVDKLFDRLETRYGRLFVSRALAYVTAAKNGLAVAELEDILSCDDDVLDSVCLISC